MLKLFLIVLVLGVGAAFLAWWFLRPKSDE
jgi:hypothetical protein